MATTFGGRLQHAWNAFVSDQDREVKITSMELGYGSTYPSGKYKMYIGNEKTIINSIYSRMAIDLAAIDFYEAKTDENGNPVEKYDSGLTECLTIEANIDQSARAFLQNIAMTLFDVGHAAVVPVDTSLDPGKTDSYDIKSMRVGYVTQWYPAYVKVNLYNDKTGHREDILLPKKMVAIIENPLYPIMNEPNSTLKRLLNKLQLLDIVDEQSSSGKLNMIIQLPYVIKSEARKQQAEERRAEIEAQLKSSKYGIAYTDGTEKIQQLGHSVENNFLTQIEYLTGMLYDQLGITKEIMNGTANDQTMLNYYNHTIEPIAAAISEELTRKFLTKTARTQKRRVVYMRDPFKLVPVNNIAEIADKFTRNEIMSSNEIRSIIGLRPSNQEGADDLRNKNLYDMSQPSQETNQQEMSPTENDQNETVNLETSGLMNIDFSNFTVKDYAEMADKLDTDLKDLEDFEKELQSDNSLKHYALGDYRGVKGDSTYSNKYYDPEYAHNYYMNHRKISTNTSSTTSKDNEEENDTKNDLTKKSIDEKIASNENKKEASLNQLNKSADSQKQMYYRMATNTLSNLKESYKNLTPDEKKKQANSYKAQTNLVKSAMQFYKVKMKESIDEYTDKIEAEYKALNYVDSHPDESVNYTEKYDEFLKMASKKK